MCLGFFRSVVLEYLQQRFCRALLSPLCLNCTLRSRHKLQTSRRPAVDNDNGTDGSAVTARTHYRRDPRNDRIQISGTQNHNKNYTPNGKEGLESRGAEPRGLNYGTKVLIAVPELQLAGAQAVRYFRPPFPLCR